MKEKINQTAGRLKQTVRAVGVGIATLTASFFMSAPAYAAGVHHRLTGGFDFYFPYM